jgi:hypothetical protein
MPKFRLPAPFSRLPDQAQIHARPILDQAPCPESGGDAAFEGTAIRDYDELLEFSSSR